MELTPKERAAIDKACAEDIAYFKSHPGTVAYQRDLIDGEFPGEEFRRWVAHDRPPNHRVRVEVAYVTDGIRMRRPVFVPWKGN